MKSLILIGFGPFGHFSTNLSGEIVKRFSIEDERFSIVKKIIPVSWKRCIRTYEEKLSRLASKPLLVILLGVHLTNIFHLENMGWNFKIGKDIDSKFKFGPIKFNFCPWIKTMLNLKKVYSVIEDKTNVSISYFAGSYLCNYLYYWALLLSKKEYPVIFIHVPNKGDLSEHVKKVEIISKAIIKTYLKLEL
ncbi:MAG: hypothetical protein HWN81_09030 [Candidatus Lokiarchaeota archaeon]|nr:hypothetical protein [Candidatus Lokiarchaeota archaeon]